MTTHHLDTLGLICPEPVMLLHRTIAKAAAGDTIIVLATDPASQRDIANFCAHLGHTLVSSETLGAVHVADGDDAADFEVHYRYTITKKS